MFIPWLGKKKTLKILQFYFILISFTSLYYSPPPKKKLRLKKKNQRALKT